jgi:guanylate kinase
MTQVGVILYGPPASGKDTITHELARLDPRYAPFQRMKIGTGNTNGYRLASPEERDRLHADGQVLYQNERYGNTYVVDRPHLSEMLNAGQTPVIHLGQLAGVRAVTTFPARWVTVLLWCSRQTTAERAQARGSTDIDARLAAWDETLADLKAASTSDFLMHLDTDTTNPGDAAKMIDLRVSADRPAPDARGAQPA